MTLFNTSDPALRTGSVGEETAANVNVDIRDEDFDLVIMNPPFTRNTGQEGEHIGVADRAFAAFNASEKDQRDMGRRLTELKGDTCYHGNAGIASAFVGLADKKLKPGGVLALVLPLSIANGLSWESARELLADGYSELTVLSIAANGRDMSFSSDTGMAECLVVARKLQPSEGITERIQFISFGRRPQGFASAGALAAEVIGSCEPRCIEDGPYGGTAIWLGDEVSGYVLSTPLDAGGSGWGGVRLLDYSLAQTAYGLSKCRLWLPGAFPWQELDIAQLNTIGKMGTYHIDINGPLPRGPFDKHPPSPTSSYPCLWNHDAQKETRIVCVPDSQLDVRPGMEAKAALVWTTASRVHLNRDFTFGSQGLSAAFTDVESMGGRVWPNVICNDKRYDFAFSIWSNSTLGLLLYWWHSSRQQSSKAGMTIRTAETLPVLDFRTLTDQQLQRAEGIFEEFRDKELQPACLADADPNRALLDRRVVCDLLGFDEETYRGVRRLAAKWCAEPSVHGGKARPKSAKYVE